MPDRALATEADVAELVVADACPRLGHILLRWDKRLLGEPLGQLLDRSDCKWSTFGAPRPGRHRERHKNRAKADGEASSQVQHPRLPAVSNAPQLRLFRREMAVRRCAKNPTLNPAKTEVIRKLLG